MVYMILIIAGFAVLLIVGGFFWLCHNVYRDHREIKGINTLIWRHPEHSLIADEIESKTKDLENYTEQNRELLEQQPTFTFWEQLPFRGKEKKRILKMKAEVKAQIKQRENEIVSLKKERLHLGIPILEFADIENAPGGDWYYKPGGISGWFMGEKILKWCYEVSTSHNPKYRLEAFDPEKYIKSESITASELAEAIEWTFAKDFFGLSNKLLKTLAMGGLVLLGLASMVGIVFLSIFVQGG